MEDDNKMRYSKQKYKWQITPNRSFEEETKSINTQTAKYRIRNSAFYLNFEQRKHKADQLYIPLLMMVFLKLFDTSILFCV